MPITSIQRDTPNNVSVVRVTTTDNLAIVASANYIADQMITIRALNSGFWQWYISDMLLISASDGLGFFEFIDSTFNSLIIYGSPGGGVVSPGLQNQVAYYPVTGDRLAGLTTGNNKVLTTNATGVPGIRDLANVTAPGVANRYVSTAGTDSPTSGSLAFPYQTIAYAMSQISVNPNGINLILLDGPYDEHVQILYKPYVNLVGFTQSNTIINNDFDVILDSSWNGETNFPTCTIINVELFNSLNFDFTPFTTSQMILQFYNFNVFQFTINGGTVSAPDGNGSSLQLYNSFTFNVTIDNIAFVDSFNNIHNDVGSYGTNGSLNTMRVVFTGCRFQSDLNLGSSGPANQDFILRGCWITQGPLSINGSSNVTVDIDVVSWRSPNISGTPTITLNSISDGLNADYSPVNYTPVATPPTLTESVQAHLHGIDNALGGITSDSTHLVFVASTGSDVSGNGSLGLPYATVAHAMTTITTATNINQFTIVVIDLITEVAQILLKPYVSISGISNASKINMFGNMILDASWGVLSGSVTSFNNVTFNLHDIIIDLSAVAGTSNPKLYFNNILLSGNTLQVNGNGSIFPFVTVNSSDINTLTLDNCTATITNNTIVNLNCGSNTYTNNLFINATNNTFDENVSLIGSTGGSFTEIFNFVANFISVSITIENSDATLNIDDTSYNNLIVFSTPTVNLLTVSNGLLANYSPSNYTPTATPPTLTTSVQAHLHGIDNALASFNVEIKNWTDITSTSQTIAVANGYTANNAGLVTFTLPATAAYGTQFAIVGKGAGGWKIAQNAGQNIHVGSSSSTVGVGGSIASSNQFDSVRFVCTTANTTWTVLGAPQGNLTIV